MGSHMNLLAVESSFSSWRHSCGIEDASFWSWVPFSEGWSLTICSESSPCFKLVNLLPWPCRPSSRHTGSVASRGVFPLQRRHFRCVVSASVVAACGNLAPGQGITPTGQSRFSTLDQQGSPHSILFIFLRSVAHRVTILKMPTPMLSFCLNWLGDTGQLQLVRMLQLCSLPPVTVGLAVLSDVAQASSPAVLGSKSGHSRSLMLVSSWEKSAGTHC